MNEEQQKSLIRRGPEAHHGTMTPSERECEQAYEDLPYLGDAPAAHRLKIPLTRHRAALTIVFGYAALAWGGKMMLAYSESTRGYSDTRDDQMVLLFGCVMAFLCIKSLLRIYWPDKRSHEP